VLTLTPMLEVEVYVPRARLERVLLDIGKEGLLHLVDAKEDFYDEIAKGLLKPIDVSARLYKISLLSSRVERISSMLNLTPSSSLEGLNEEDVISFSISDCEAYLDSLEKLLSSGDELIMERVKKEHGEKVSRLNALLKVLEVLETAKAKAVETPNVVIFSGWLPRKFLKVFTDVMERACSRCYVVKYEEPKPHREAHQEVKVPSLMKNPSWTRVYEGLVRGLGTLNYKEIDPTIIWFFTFPIFFGIMFPDVGHGLVLLALSIPLYYLKRKGYRGGEISSYIVQGAPVLMACAITSTIFGVIFGEFFGNPHSEHHPFHVFGFDPFKDGTVAQFRAWALSILGLPKEFHVLEPSGATALLRLTIYIAIFHITLGLAFSVVNKVRLGEYKEAILGPGLWLWLYLGAGMAFVIYRSRLIPAALGGDPMVFILIWFPFIVMFIARMIFMGFLDGFGESLDHFIASLSNTISYARLFAFAIVHAVLSDVFLAVDHGLYVMIGVPFIGAIAGTMFFVFFEIVFVFFQALRLHWVEHGTKFLIADGIPFQPFIIKS